MDDRAAVLMSLKPEWWEKIRSSRKTVELRRVTPVDLVPGMPIVWYVSAPESAIAGEADIFAITSQEDAMKGPALMRPDRYRELWYQHAGMDLGSARDYWSGAQSPCAIWLREVREYEKTVAMVASRWEPETQGSVFWLSPPPQSFRYLTTDQLAGIRRAAGME